MGFKSEKFQYYAAFCVNIMSVGYGAACGWPSASFLVLKSDETPLPVGPLSDNEISWIGSILCIGGLVGNLTFGGMADKFGRKISMLMCAVPNIAAWIIIILAENSLHLSIARFLLGASGGGTFALTPTYITEISEDQIRGLLGSYMILSANLGVLISFLLGYFLSYETIPYILLAFPILFVITFSFLPETPQHLLKIKKLKQAERALRYFRNFRKTSQEPPQKFKDEMEKLKTDYLEDDKTKKINDDDGPLKWSDFTTHQAKKAILISTGICALNQLCGCFALLNYTATIFKQSGSTLSPNLCAIFVGIIQLLGSYISTLLVERAGRKLLLTISLIGIGFGLTALGLFSYFSQLNFDLSYFQWVPVTGFSFALFIGSFGIISLPFLVVSEIMPPKIRSVGTTFCLTILWIMSFVLVKFLPLFTDLFGMHGVMGFFATWSFAGSIFVMSLVPETKGKSIDEILASL